MNTCPAISVITPVYKGIKFLRSTFACMKAQTFSDWEWILVDDESKDGSGALVDELAASDSRLRVIHQKNGGTSVARNTAMAAARGKYFAFLDEDDLYHPRYLETLLNLAEKHQADITGCRKMMFDENAKPEFPDGGPAADAEVKVADRAGICEWLAGLKAEIPCEVWLNLYRRDIFGDLPFPPGVRVEQDFRWHYSALPRCRKYARLNWTGYAWRSTGAGGWLNPNADSMISHVETYRLLASTLPKEMGLNERQLKGFLDGFDVAAHVNFFFPLKHGVRLTRGESRTLRQGIRSLYPIGIDLRRKLHFRKRLLWNLFMLTGCEAFVRI
jgi:glycosyltransferase involved in cell wall biosynthesis